MEAQTENNEIAGLKAEIYDVNKALNNANQIINAIVSRLKVPTDSSGVSIESVFERLDYLVGLDSSVEEEKKSK